MPLDLFKLLYLQDQSTFSNYFYTIFKLRMSNPLLTLKGAYGSGSESDSDTEIGINPKLKFAPLNVAPSVVTDYDVNTERAVDISSGEIVYNPTAREMYMPDQAPKHPDRKTGQAAAERNMLAGYAEKEHISDFAFETQRKTYHSYGFAVDPSRVSCR
jgi:hypothetical protein